MRLRVCVRERCRHIGIPLAGPMEVQHFISMSHNTRCTGPRPDEDDGGDVHVVVVVSWSQVALLGAPIRLVGISGPIDGRLAYTRYVIYIIIMDTYYIVIMPPEPFSKTVSEISDRPESLISAGESPYHLNSTSSDHLVFRFISSERERERENNVRFRRTATYRRYTA